MRRTSTIIGLAHQCSALAGLCLGVASCTAEVSEPTASQPLEPVAHESAAVESATDKPAGAALQVRGPTGGPTPWIFACDSSNRLRRIIGEEWTPGFGSWQTIDTNCADVPTAGKWVVGNYDSVFVYIRSGAGNLWEAWWPNATNDPNYYIWTNVSSVTGFGHIAGAPVLVETDSADSHVSVAVRSESTNALYTMDWFGGGWHAQKVINFGSTAIITTNRVATRGQARTSDNWAPTVIVGRGLTATDDSTGWFAYRPAGGGYDYLFFRWWSFEPPFKPNTSTPATLLGTPFPGFMPENLYGNHGNFFAATYDNRLMSSGGGPSEGTVAWWSYTAGGTSDFIEPTGSPRGATEVGIGDDYRHFYVRGRVTGQGSGNDLFWCPGQNDCVSRGGNLSSAPAMFEYATSARLRQSAIYKDINNFLRYYDALNNLHVNLGLTPLP